MIPNLTIDNLMIDCANAEHTCDFYADLMDYDKIIAFGCFALKAANDLIILFTKTDIPYLPPVWPEEHGKQQKQMHLDFSVDDLPATIQKAIRLGATKAAAQYGGEGSITMLDPEGHPFCLCSRK